jgi:hypothetical protein
MNWPGRTRLWFRTLMFHRKAIRLQHDQAIEHSGIVDEVKEHRRAATHELADHVLQLDAATDRLERVAEEGEKEEPCN